MRTALKILLFPIKLAWKIVSWIMVKVILAISVFYEVLGKYIIGTLGFIGGILWICFLGMLLFKSFDSTKECLQFLLATCSVTAVPVLLYATGERIITAVANFFVKSDIWLWNLCSD